MNTYLLHLMTERIFPKFNVSKKVLLHKILGQIFKLVQKNFFGQKTKWWVKTSYKSFVSKFFFALLAEKWRLKIFLEAFSENTGRFPKTKSNSGGHILWNFEILRPLLLVKFLILPTGAHFRLKIPNFSIHNKVKRQIS